MFSYINQSRFSDDYTKEEYFKNLKEDEINNYESTEQKFYKKILKNTNNKIELLDENDYYILYEIVNIQQILPGIENAQFKEKIKQIKLKEIVTCSIIHTKEYGIKVKLKNNLDGFIKRENLSIDESEQNPRRYAANEKLDAMIKKIDKENKIVVLSIKEIESKEQKKIKKEFGSLDSGATLGKILGEKKKK